MSAADRPVPQPDALSAPFWEHAATGVLAIQRCDRCGTFAHPPVALCDGCDQIAVPSFSFVPVSGRARLLGWTVVRTAFVRGFEDRVPFLFALVELEEQRDLRLACELIADLDVDLAVEQPVELVFDDGDGCTWLPFAHPIAGPAPAVT